MRMNNGGVWETPVHWTTRGRTKYGYIINCWNNRRTALTRDTWAGRGEIMGAWSELVLRQDLPESASEVCNRWKMMRLSVVLSSVYG